MDELAKGVDQHLREAQLCKEAIEMSGEKAVAEMADAGTFRAACMRMYVTEIRRISQCIDHKPRWRSDLMRKRRYSLKQRTI